MENRFYRVKSKCQLVEPCAEVSITSSGVYAPVIYEHCEHCNCIGCTSIVDAPRSEDKLLEHVEAEQRSTSRSSIERQLSKELPPEVISLFEGELSPPNTSEDVVQSQFLETSEELDQYDQKNEETKRVLAEAIENAEKTHKYGNLVIFTVPKGCSESTFDAEGREIKKDVRPEGNPIGRPISVTLSADPAKCGVKRGSQFYNLRSRNATIRYNPIRFRRVASVSKRSNR